MRIVQKVAGRVLELMAEGLGMQDTDVFRGMVHRDGSDELLRVNHYPPSLRLEAKAVGGTITGFGEHTDPQIMSLLRSNAVPGLQIALRDGSWLPVAPDAESVFVNVGDAMQVLTNGRYRSVRHRVVAEAGEEVRSRLSMIYFGGPAPAERIVPVAGLMGALEASLYRSFTWGEYKTAAYKTKLATCRLEPFQLQQLRAEDTQKDTSKLLLNAATAPQ
jgi:gibberellin 2-oxidase